MLSDTEVQAYIDKLADKIATDIDDPNVIEAFRRIPRHRFVQDGFYLPDKQTRELKFISLDNTAPSDWFETIYNNQVLMLSLGETGSPSSSSEPILMAFMLSALKIDAGMRILEIGTGSGYNAALLAHLVGKTGKVTTIDIQPKLTRSAQEVIRTMMGDRVSIHTGNGLLGVPQEAPYDRIIATASHNRVPEAWIKQLGNEGTLLMSFGHTGGLLLLKKHGDSLSGQFLAQRGYFMPLVELSDQPEIVIHIADIKSLLSDDFRFFAGWLLPDVVILSLSQSPDTAVTDEKGIRFQSRNGQESVIVRATHGDVKLIKQGSEAFAQKTLDVIQQWEAFEQPDSSRYGFVMDSNHQQIITIDSKKLIQLH